jgi:DNA repair protein RecO (recombination protein O)
MPLNETEAIVLRHYPLSEADRIIVFITREYGKVKAVGQGLKKIKSRLAGRLEPFNHVRLIFWSREGVELCRIRGCETLHSYLGRSPSLDRFFSYNYFAEIVEQFVQENHPNPALFRLLLASLKTGETAGTGERLIRYFEIWTLRLAGLLPDYDSCSACRKCVKEHGFYASSATGQGLCAACAPDGGPFVNPRSAAVIRSILEVAPERFIAQSNFEDAVHDLGSLTKMLMDLHLEKRMKSYESLRKILRGS